MYRNAYFQLSIKDDGVYIIIYPPLGGGEGLKFFEVSSYLVNKLKINNYDVPALKQALLSSLLEAVEVKISDAKIPSVDESVSIKVSPDKMMAIGRFYCASKEGKMFNSESILGELSKAGVNHGIVKANISQFLENRQFCTDILLASGNAMVPSRDAVLQYNFEGNKSSQPQLLEDGSVDFRQLNLINHINQGDILAVLTPPYEGVPGMDVLGKPIPPKKPAKKSFKYGKNIVVSEDGLKLIAQTPGHVEMERDGKINVSNVYQIRGDVDTSTGNIFYDGSVEIKGDVLTGYVVEVTGNIFVGGGVESATLIAGNDIILSNGIQGGNRGRLVAGGNVITKFIENSNVTAGGQVLSEAILHSKVTAGGDIVVLQKKGTVTGGEIKSGKSIAAKTIGSAKMGTNTLLEVGADPNIVERYRDLEKNILAKQTEQKKLRQLLVYIKKKMEVDSQPPADAAKLLQTIPHQITGLMTEMEELREQYIQLKSIIEQSSSGRIKVENIIYAGSKIVISNVSYYVRGSIQHCQFVREGADIKYIPY